MIFQSAPTLKIRAITVFWFVLSLNSDCSLYRTPNDKPFHLFYCCSPSFVNYIFSKCLGVTANVQSTLPGPGNSKVKDIVLTLKEFTILFEIWVTDRQ